MYKNVFFDLDGTLTDSSEGITKCAKLALEHFGITGYELSDLTCFIGPPLSHTFPKFGIPKADVSEAIRVFRSRYQTVGKFENRPYPGIPKLLGDLQKEGFHLYVATSKPEVTAREILEKFDLKKYFTCICGATLDGTRDDKDAVIRYLLAQAGTMEDIVMVGDTRYDVLGAAALQIPTIGVSWGFGSVEEMEAAGAIRIVANMQELSDALHGI